MTLPKGIRLHGAGYQARVSVGQASSQRTFPISTPIHEIEDWITDERHRLQVAARGTHLPIVRGTFADDARRYLAAVRAMPDYKSRAKDISLWVVAFGDRRRSTITSTEIRATRDRWLTVGPKHLYVKGTGWVSHDLPLAGSTVNHRLRALSNLWTVLDGRRAPNPVRDVPEAMETAQIPRAITDDYAIIEQILNALPDRGKPERHGRRPEVSLTKIRLRVMAWTGLGPRQLASLTPADVDLEGGTLRTAIRKKGKGARPTRIPLLPQAVDAFRDLAAMNAWGRFSTSSASTSFKRAVAKVRAQGIPLPAGIRVIDLRHTFGSAVYRQSGDLSAVAMLLQHTDKRTSERYVLAAVSTVLERAIAPMRPLKQAE